MSDANNSRHNWHNLKLCQQRLQLGTKQQSDEWKAFLHCDVGLNGTHGAHWRGQFKSAIIILFISTAEKSDSILSVDQGTDWKLSTNKSKSRRYMWNESLVSGFTISFSPFCFRHCWTSQCASEIRSKWHKHGVHVIFYCWKSIEIWKPQNQIPKLLCRLCCIQYGKMKQKLTLRSAASKSVHTEPCIK